MTTIKAIRLASLVTAINVLIASGFSIAGRLYSIFDADVKGLLFTVQKALPLLPNGPRSS